MLPDDIPTCMRMPAEAWPRSEEDRMWGIACERSFRYTEQMTKSEQLPTSTDAVSNHLLVKIAELYFLDDLTQLQIGRRLGISRQKVQRLIRAAKEKGIVQITIQPVRKTSSHLERQLEKQFSLKEALVVETDEYDDHDKVAQALGSPSAEYLLRVIDDGDSLAVSWGSTLRGRRCLARARQAAAERTHHPGSGGIGQSKHRCSCQRLDQTHGAHFRREAILLPAPGVVKTSAAAPGPSRRLSRGTRVDRRPQRDDCRHDSGRAAPGLAPDGEGQIVSWPELMQLREQGAVGDINLRYFDGQGRAIPSDLDLRTISLTIEDIRRIDRVVVIAGGRRKFKAIAAALQGRLPDVLITDSTTARRLLKIHPQSILNRNSKNNLFNGRTAMSNKRIVVLATLDTKGREAQFLREQIEKSGDKAIVIDTGVTGSPAAKADITRGQVAAAGGAPLNNYCRIPIAKSGHPDGRRAAKIVGKLLEQGEIHGIIGLGGTQGTTLCTKVMRALPYGFPKIMVSTMASGDVSRWVDIKDITMMFSVPTFSG